MEKQQVWIGTVVATSGGITQDATRQVEFVADKLGARTEYDYDGERLTDTRGVTETLYRTEDDRLVVHVKDWSHWAGEPTTYSLHEVVAEDLQPGGDFEALGAECGFGRPLTLDEVLSEHKEADEG
jgi:hypothetical protein